MLSSSELLDSRAVAVFERYLSATNMERATQRARAATTSKSCRGRGVRRVNKDDNVRPSERRDGAAGQEAREGKRNRKSERFEWMGGGARFENMCEGLSA